MQQANSLNKISIKLKRILETKQNLNKALKDKHEEQELNMIAARNKNEHSTKIEMKTMSILGKSGACFSPKQGMLGSNLL